MNLPKTFLSASYRNRRQTAHRLKFFSHVYSVVRSPHSHTFKRKIQLEYNSSVHCQFQFIFVIILQFQKNKWSLKFFKWCFVDIVPCTAVQSIRHQLINKINGGEVTYEEMKKIFHFEYKDTNSTNLVRLTYVSLIFLSSN